MIRYHNRNIPKKEDSKNSDINENDDDEDEEAVKKIIKGSDNVFSSPSTFLKNSEELSKKIAPFSLSPETKSISHLFLDMEDVSYKNYYLFLYGR